MSFVMDEWRGQYYIIRQWRKKKMTDVIFFNLHDFIEQYLRYRIKLIGKMFLNAIERNCEEVDRKSLLHQVLHLILFGFSVANVTGSLVLAFDMFASIFNYGSGKLGFLVGFTMLMCFCHIIILLIAEVVVVVFPIGNDRDIWGSIIQLNNKRIIIIKCF